MANIKKEIDKLKAFYGCSNAELADKIGITERHIYNCINGYRVGKVLKKYIEEMVKKIESL